MRRRTLSLALAASAVVGGSLASVAWDAARPAAPRAEAVSAGQVIGTWQVKLAGDVWVRNGGYRAEKPRYEGLLIFRNASADVNSGLVEAELRVAFDKDDALAAAIGENPVLTATARVVGDSMAAIDEGFPIWVNAINLQFDPSAKRLTGVWMWLVPSGETSDAEAVAGGASLTLKGKRIRRPSDRADAASPSDPAGPSGARSAR